METAEKPTIAIMPTGIHTADGEDLQALHDLRDKLASKKFIVELQHSEYVPEPPVLLGPMNGAYIILRDIAAEDNRVNAAVKHAVKGTRRWLRKRFSENPGAGELHITIWSQDARRLKEIVGTSAEHFKDVTPELPKPVPPTPVKLVGLWDTLRGFTWPTRIFLFLSLLFGAVATLYLWATDANIDVKLGDYDLKRPGWLVPYSHEWLNSHAYIPNVLAAATGFLIGAPFALIVLATFTVQREERTALERVNKLSAPESVNLNEAPSSGIY